jgi:hypothetical protein
MLATTTRRHRSLCRGHRALGHIAREEGILTRRGTTWEDTNYLPLNDKTWAGLHLPVGKDGWQVVILFSDCWNLGSAGAKMLAERRSARPSNRIRLYPGHIQGKASVIISFGKGISAAYTHTYMIQGSPAGAVITVPYTSMNERTTS